MSPKKDEPCIDIITVKAKLEGDSGVYQNVTDLSRRVTTIESDLIKYTHTTRALWKAILLLIGALFSVGTLLFNILK